MFLAPRDVNISQVLFKLIICERLLHKKESGGQTTHRDINLRAIKSNLSDLRHIICHLYMHKESLVPLSLHQYPVSTALLIADLLQWDILFIFGYMVHCWLVGCEVVYPQQVVATGLIEVKAMIY